MIIYFLWQEYSTALQHASTNIPVSAIDLDVEVYNYNNLNEKQKIAFNIVIDWIDRKMAAMGVEANQQNCVDCAPCTDDDIKPILLQINGKGGTGKSFFLHCLKTYIRETYGSTDFMKCMAPTGTAGFNIHGTTLHAALRIPVNYSRKVSVSTMSMNIF